MARHEAGLKLDLCCAAVHGAALWHTRAATHSHGTHKPASQPAGPAFRQHSAADTNLRGGQLRQRCTRLVRPCFQAWPDLRLRGTGTGVYSSLQWCMVKSWLRGQCAWRGQLAVVSWTAISQRPASLTARAALHGKLRAADGPVRGCRRFEQLYNTQLTLFALALSTSVQLAGVSLQLSDVTVAAVFYTSFSRASYQQVLPSAALSSELGAAAWSLSLLCAHTIAAGCCR